MAIDYLNNGELASIWREKLNRTIAVANESLDHTTFKGDPGPRGPQGLQGPKGDAGNYLSVNVTNVVASEADLPPGAPLGEQYGVESGNTVELYINTSTGWTNYGPLTNQDIRNVPHTIFVTPDGDDNYDGRTFGKSLRTIEAAAQAAAELAGGMDLGPLANSTLIQVYPGDYKTFGHVDFPDGCTIYGIGGARKTRILPEDPVGSDVYAQRNVFRVGDAGYIEGFSFEGFQVHNPNIPDDPFEDPTEGFAVAFRPNAIINRVPYAHNITAYTSFPPRTQVSPPLDREKGNPLVGAGGGVAIADGSVISGRSAFPNIMTWGATPSTPNGVGYHARNGGLLNPINAICLWAHKHFMVTGGAQMVLSGCSSQFGDYTLWSQGVGYSPIPADTQGPLLVDDIAAMQIELYTDQLVDNLWAQVLRDGFCGCACSADVYEANCKADIELILLAFRYCLRGATQRPLNQFIRGMFDYKGDLYFDDRCSEQYVLWWEYLIEDIIRFLVNTNIRADTPAMLRGLGEVLRVTFLGPTGTEGPKRKLERSLLTAINHQWTLPGAGVTRDAIPTRFKNSGKISKINRTIKQTRGGRVRYSGQDDDGNAVFVGGLRIDARSGELQGPPFDAAVRQRAVRIALARSF